MPKNAGRRCKRENMAAQQTAARRAHPPHRRPALSAPPGTTKRLQPGRAGGGVARAADQPRQRHPGRIAARARGGRPGRRRRARARPGAGGANQATKTDQPTERAPCGVANRASYHSGAGAARSLRGRPRWVRSGGPRNEAPPTNPGRRQAPLGRSTSYRRATQAECGLT